MTGQQLRLNLFQSTRELFIFSMPIVFGQLGIMLIGFGDIYVASLHGTLSAAALGVAMGFISPIFLLGVGLLLGVSPVLAIKRGRHQSAETFFFSNILYSQLMSLLMMLLMFIIYFFIPFVGLQKEIVPFVQKYIFMTLWSFPFAFLFQVIKEHLQSQEKVLLANFTALLGVIINLILNVGFVFGKWNFPEIGFDGLAYASVGVRIFMALSLLSLTVNKKFKLMVDWKYLKEVLQFSLPIAGMFFLEVLGFSLVSIIVGTLGVAESAANNIVLNLASLSFMIPLSISNAVTVKVGLEYGRKKFQGIVRYTLSALLLSWFFMGLTCLVYIIMPEFIMSQVTTEKSVMMIGIKLLVIVGIFQLVDGTQVTLAGVLRGIERTKESFYAIFFGHWVLGLPLGLYLTYIQGLKPEGLWIGLASALAVVSLALSVVTKKQFNRMSNGQFHPKN